MKYLLVSVFIHVFLIICITFLNVGQDLVLPKNNEKTVTIDLIPATYKQAKEKLNIKSVSKVKKVTRLIKKKLKSKVITQHKPSFNSPEVVSDIEETQQSAEQVKQAQLSYVQKLKLYIEKNKHYPRQAIRLKQSGVVKLRLRINKQGVFSGVELVGSSEFPILDEAALNLIKKIGKFNPLPSKIKPNSYFTVPIAYSLRR